MNNQLIVDFWQKFHEISDNLLANYDDQNLIAYIDNLVEELGDFDWELGPSENKALYFCLSPNLNTDLLESTTEVISHAPNLDKWEFLSAKPPKEWVPEIIINHDTVIDYENWRCVVYKFSDGIFEIDIEISDYDINSEDINIAVDIILTNLLGEKKYMKLVESVKLLQLFSPKEKARSIHIKDLPCIID